MNCERCGEIFDESELSDITGMMLCDPCAEIVHEIEEKEEELTGAKKALEDAKADVILWDCMVKKLQKELDEMY